MTTPPDNNQRNRKPGDVGPGIAATQNQARIYERELRRTILDPFVRRIQRRIDSARQNYEAIRLAIREIPDSPELQGLSTEAAERQAARIKARHTQQFTQKMSQFFGVNVGPMTPDLGVDGIMRQHIRQNVSLIKTIPQRHHRKLSLQMVKLSTDAPFDQQELSRILRETYKSSGWNLRRLTRDQTSKLIGNLNHARQQQIGIEEYQWLTSEDERVRQTHASNSGLRFRWDSPPIVTGHPGTSIMCRCVALPVMPPPPEFAIEPPDNGQPPTDIGTRPYMDGPVEGTNLAEDRTMDRFAFNHTELNDYVDRDKTSKASQSYFKDSYQSINKALRSGKPLSRTMQARVDSIRSDMKPLSQNVRVYRGDTRNLDLAVGDIFDEQGFLSMTTNSSTSFDSFSKGQTMFQAEIPKGVRGIVDNAGESEILFDAGMKFRVREVLQDFKFMKRELDPSGGIPYRWVEKEQTVSKLYILEAVL